MFLHILYFKEPCQACDMTIIKIYSNFYNPRKCMYSLNGCCKSVGNAIVNLIYTVSISIVNKRKKARNWKMCCFNYAW